jgi:hypothetical protein
MKLSDLFLNRFLYRDNNQNLETKDAAFVSADSSGAEPSSIPSGGAAQDINTGNVQIDGAQLEPGTFPQTTLDVSNWGWGQTCVFSSTDLNTVSWGAGTFKSADGTSYSISAGNTGNMSAKTYIYLDLLTSETAYQITTTPATAVGIGKVLVAVANPDTTTATYNLSEATQIVGDNILANSINASKITTGQLIVGTNVGLGTAQDSAGVTTIVGNTITTSYVNALNITALGTVTAGALVGVSVTAKSGSSTIAVMNSSGVRVNGQNFNVYDSTGATLYGYVGGYGGYFNLQAVSGRNMLIGASNATVFFGNDVGTAAPAGGLLGSSSAPWNTIYGGNLVSNNLYAASSSSYIRYFSSAWNFQHKVVAPEVSTPYLTGINTIRLASTSTPLTDEGSIYFNGTHLYIRIGGAWKQLDN